MACEELGGGRGGDELSPSVLSITSAVAAVHHAPRCSGIVPIPHEVFKELGVKLESNLESLLFTSNFVPGSAHHCLVL